MDYTFLELVQMTARESGTIPSDLPQTVAGQVGRVAKIVHWVNEAWNRIQISHAYWEWMHDTFQCETSVGLAMYSPLQFGIYRFARWVELPYTMSAYKKTLGKSDENHIQPMLYREYRRIYDIGEQENARPSVYAVSPTNMLHIGPTPDDEYIIRGEYYKSAQLLQNDGDIPELPHNHRPIIAWYALVLLSQYDEAGFALGNAFANYRGLLADLERDQLPTLRMIGVMH